MLTTADRSRNRYGLPLLAALLLHVGLILLAWVSWVTAPPARVVASVPVELVSQVPSHEQMETPVDKLAVKTPAPEPAPEEPVKPEPVPTPAPKLPVPTQKEIAKPAPKAAEAPVVPDKNGTKKPQPDKAKPAQPALDLGALANQMAAQSAKAKTRTPAQANTHATNGNSAYGNAPADAGTQTALTALTQRLQRLWNPSCDVPGFNTVHPDIRFTISASGRVIQGPDWTNPRSDKVWEAAAARAKTAVKQGELYDDLPKELYNRPLVITFDGQKACG
jgi:outer membrane biosynthesis protein TonB